MPWTVIGRDGDSYLIRDDDSLRCEYTVCRILELSARRLSPPIPLVTAAKMNPYWEDFEGDHRPILDAMKTATLAKPSDALKS